MMALSDTGMTSTATVLGRFAGRLNDATTAVRVAVLTAAAMLSPKERMVSGIVPRCAELLHDRVQAVRTAAARLLLQVSLEERSVMIGPGPGMSIALTLLCSDDEVASRMLVARKFSSLGVVERNPHVGTFRLLLHDKDPGVRMIAARQVADLSADERHTLLRRVCSLRDRDLDPEVRRAAAAGLCDTPGTKAADFNARGGVDRLLDEPSEPIRNTTTKGIVSKSSRRPILAVCPIGSRKSRATTYRALIMSLQIRVIAAQITHHYTCLPLPVTTGSGERKRNTVDDVLAPGAFAAMLASADESERARGASLFGLLTPGEKDDAFDLYRRLFSDDSALVRAEAAKSVRLLKPEWQDELSSKLVQAAQWPFEHQRVPRYDCFSVAHHVPSTTVRVIMLC